MQRTASTFIRSQVFKKRFQTSTTAVCVQHRGFNVIQRGNDKETESLFVQLGFGKENEGYNIHRTREELRQGFMREAMKLGDPEHNEEDKIKLNKLKKVYSLLSNDSFRARYASHHCASPDASLHILLDGDQFAANFNPEHQSFDFVEHALSSSSAGMQRSFADFTRQFQTATGAFESPQDAHPHDARTARAAKNGASINFLLRISFDESILGCTKIAVYEKNMMCSRCAGEGRESLKKPRKCPQCRGRGSIHLPSATYHIDRPCKFCNGDGTAPLPKCGACMGVGLVAGHTVRVPIDVRPGTTTMTVRRLRGKGHDGVRGGTPGELIVTVLVQEHRLFYRDGLDLHMVLPIPLSTALLGGVVSVPTLHGMKPLRVPPCVRNGQRLILEGMGVQLDESSQTVERREKEIYKASAEHHQQMRCEGHLYIHTLVMIPRAEDLTGTQRYLLERFEDMPDSNVCKDNEETPEGLKQRFKHWFTSA